MASLYTHFADTSAAEMYLRANGFAYIGAGQWLGYDHEFTAIIKPCGHGVRVTYRA